MIYATGCKRALRTLACIALEVLVEVGFPDVYNNDYAEGHLFFYYRQRDDSASSRPSSPANGNPISRAASISQGLSS
ncbi:MAG: hypothetical protein MK538_06555 [Planctomycetes bacterium]|nr:hypothetical protein [Planctomycetota bacterium]